ncbi:unnamed protein product [Calicophoron daubneyi]|uniref:Uncharacterized protein n=1 Tax=Calicophoron daubneyi TaxID=300641 RepID=A0AAV2TEU5_CALDB
MIHNHLCSKLEYDLHPAARKLTADEEADLLRLLKYNAPTDNVRLLAQLQFGKYLTNSDISNLRQKSTKASIDTRHGVVVVNRTDPIRKVSAYRRKHLPVFCDKPCVVSEQNNDPSGTAHEPADGDPSLTVIDPQDAECREGLAAKEMEIIHRAQVLKSFLAPGLYSCLLDRIAALMDECGCTFEDSKKSSERKSMPDSQTFEKFTKPSTSREQRRYRRYLAVNLDLCFKRTSDTDENTKRPRTIRDFTVDADAQCKENYPA